MPQVVAQQHSAQRGECIRRILELVENRSALADRQGDGGELPLEGVGDDRRRAQRVRAAVGDEAGDEPARVRFGDRDPEEAQDGF